MTTASPVPVEIMLHRQPVDGRKDGLLRTAAAAIGATCFSLGACFFIVQSFQEDWLPLFRVGCIVWLVGCAPYLALALAYARKAALSSTMLLVTGLTTYVVGCVFGLRTDIDEALPAINACFAVGSALLLVDSALEMRRQWPRPDCVCVAELLAGSFFCVAAGLGGYGPTLLIVQVGLCCWLAGSILYYARPCHDRISRARLSKLRCDGSCC